MPNAYYWLQGGREGGQNSQKPAYVIHGCSLTLVLNIISNQIIKISIIRKNHFRSLGILKIME